MTKAREDLAPKSSEVKTRDVALYELESRFDLVGGHRHDGTDSPRVTFNDLVNINVESPTDGEVLRWDNSTSNWINNSLIEAGIASTVEFESHTLATTSVHGISDTSDLVLKSGSINQLADITSSGITVEDAVSKRHAQNTDTGTNSATFYLGLNGPKIKNNSDVIEIRNNNDSDYANLIVNNLIVKGTTTIGLNGPKIKNNSDVIEIRNNNDSDYANLIVNNLIVKGTTTTTTSETVLFDNNILILNSNYSGSSPTINAGLEVERGSLTNASLIWDESNDLWKVGLVGSEKVIVTEDAIKNLKEIVETIGGILI